MLLRPFSLEALIDRELWQARCLYLSNDTDDGHVIRY